MSWTVAVALAALLVSIIVLYRSLTSRRGPRPELDDLRRENARLQERLEQAEDRLGIRDSEPTPLDEDRP